MCWLPGIFFLLDILLKHYELRNSVEARCTETYRAVVAAVNRIGVQDEIQELFGRSISMDRWTKRLRTLQSRIYVSKELVHIALTAPAARMEREEIELKEERLRLRFKDLNFCFQNADESNRTGSRKTIEELLNDAVGEAKLLSPSKTDAR